MRRRDMSDNAANIGEIRASKRPGDLTPGRYSRSCSTASEVSVSDSARRTSRIPCHVTQPIASAPFASEFVFARSNVSSNALIQQPSGCRGFQRAPAGSSGLQRAPAGSSRGSRGLQWAPEGYSSGLQGAPAGSRGLQRAPEGFSWLRRGLQRGHNAWACRRECVISRRYNR